MPICSVGDNCCLCPMPDSKAPVGTNLYDEMTLCLSHRQMEEASRLSLNNTDLLPLVMYFYNYLCDKEKVLRFRDLSQKCIFLKNFAYSLTDSIQTIYHLKTSHCQIISQVTAISNSPLRTLTFARVIITLISQ